MKFSSDEYWKALILYGLNQATYKIALGKTLITLAEKGNSHVSWENLSKEFLNQYSNRLNVAEPMPQQGNPARKTVMERIVDATKAGMTQDEAIARVGENAFGDVIQRFHSLGNNQELQGKFYTFQHGKYLELTDELFRVVEKDKSEITQELDARWSLLEGSFTLHDNFQISNDVRSIYLTNSLKRKNLTNNIPFLQGYQGNSCFYCGEKLIEGDIHVDHLLPRQVLNHDEIWNLVLAHSLCNERKSDNLVGTHYIEKLISRNENIIGSNHPWKEKIKTNLGKTPSSRRSKLTEHYENVKKVLGITKYWGGTPFYNPESDMFYRRFITVLNNKSNS